MSPLDCSADLGMLPLCPPLSGPLRARAMTVAEALYTFFVTNNLKAFHLLEQALHNKMVDMRQNKQMLIGFLMIFTNTVTLCCFFCAVAFGLRYCGGWKLVPEELRLGSDMGDDLEAAGANKLTLNMASQESHRSSTEGAVDINEISEELVLQRMRKWLKWRSTLTPGEAEIETKMLKMELDLHDGESSEQLHWLSRVSQWSVSNALARLGRTVVGSVRTILLRLRSHDDMAEKWTLDNAKQV
jgi:hypothetical protein